MKFFPVDSAVDEMIENLMRQIRHLKDGETAELIEKSGAHYRVNYGVSLVHLRKMAETLSPEDALARRLWYRQIRETMIIATMVADVKVMGEEEVNAWGDMLNTIELSEQMGRNLLVKKEVSQVFLENWLQSGHFYKQYAGAMGIGWRIRMSGEAVFEDIDALLPILESMVEEVGNHRAVGFALKMAGRFLPSVRPVVFKMIEQWSTSFQPDVKQLAEEVRFELEAFM